MERKTLGGLAIKNEDRGEVQAVFATFDVVDKDGDVVERNAFTDGQEVIISAYGHKTWDGLLPVGKGTVRTTKSEAILDGRFFMNTQQGKDTFLTIKEVGDLQEYSWGFDITKHSFEERDDKQVRILHEVALHEVSPVLRGASIGTRTLAVKGADALKFGEEAQAVVAAVSALADRAADVMAKRAEKGKGLGADSAALLELVNAELKRLATVLDPGDDAPDVSREVERELLRFLASNAA